MASWLDSDNVRHYDGSVVKMTFDWVEVVSDTVVEGVEMLRHYAYTLGDSGIPDHATEIHAALVNGDIVFTWLAPVLTDPNVTVTGFLVTVLTDSVVEAELQWSREVAVTAPYVAILPSPSAGAFFRVYVQVRGYVPGLGHILDGGGAFSEDLITT